MTASGGLFAGFYPGAVGSAIADRQRTARGRELGHAARGRASSGMLPLPPPRPPTAQSAHGAARARRAARPTQATVSAGFTLSQPAPPAPAPERAPRAFATRPSWPAAIARS